MEAHIKIATLAGWVVYLVSVVVLEGLYLALSGQVFEVSQLVLVTSTLVIAALVHPLRLRVRDHIERRSREARALRAAREAQGRPHQ